MLLSTIFPSKFRRGKLLGFLGPNGAGKTTTMRVLTCFLPPTAGSANVAGFDVTEQPIEVKKRIGYLPETPPLYPEMEVGEYLRFAGQLKGLGGQDLTNRIQEVSEQCSVADVEREAHQQAVEGLPAAGRAGAGDHPQPGCPGAGRADVGAGSRADHPHAGPDQEPGRQPHDHPEHAHPPGGGGDVRAGDHHQQGQAGWPTIRWRT